MMSKKIYTLLVATAISFSSQAQRFLTEVFPSVSKSSNITYGVNQSVITGAPAPDTLKMDVYQPSGIADTMSRRPLVIFLHTGSYLPEIYNGTPTGNKNDSAAVEISTQMAKRGYVVANINYRLGWNPAGSTVDIRRSSLLRAVFRSIQDTKAAVRFFKKDQATTNTYMIDSNKIILMGQGTGGYVALNYIYLNSESQIQIPKFISNTTDVANDLTIGQAYIQFSKYGDQDGYGGIPLLNNPNNSPGHTNDVAMVINLSGAVGDSSWVTAGAPPVMSFHVQTDPFAPYMHGIVFVPGNPPQSVIDVSGSGYIVPKSVMLGNNACMENNGFTDAYTTRANAINGGNEGLFPFQLSGPQAGPWEWFDSVAVVNWSQAIGNTAAAGTAAYTNGKITNPDMSKAKALAYIDTIMGYANPRIVKCLNLAPAGIRDLVLSNDILLFPNPAQDIIQVRLPNHQMQQIQLLDVTGRQLRQWNAGKVSSISLPLSALQPGVYLLQVQTTNGIGSKRFVLQ